MSDDPEYADDLEYEDDPFEVFDPDEQAEEEKPEPMAFPDAYSAALQKPVELVAPEHSDSIAVLKQAEESRFPAKRVAKSAASLAQALRAAAAKVAAGAK